MFSELVPDVADVPDVLDCTMMFYAAEVGSFTDLAAVVTRSAGDGEHLPAWERVPGRVPGTRWR